MTSSDRLRLFRSTAKEKRVGKGGREGSEAEVASVSISRFFANGDFNLISSKRNVRSFLVHRPEGNRIGYRLQYPKCMG